MNEFKDGIFLHFTNMKIEGSISQLVLASFSFYFLNELEADRVSQLFDLGILLLLEVNIQQSNGWLG